MNRRAREQRPAFSRRGVNALAVLTVLNVAFWVALIWAAVSFLTR